jgi:ribosomal protein L39E
MSSHKKIEQFLTKKQKQNCPFLYWIQMKTSSRIRHSSKRETLEKNWARSIRNCKPQSHQKKKRRNCTSHGTHTDTVTIILHHEWIAGHILLGIWFSLLCLCSTLLH